ncbi:DMT family transporter [Loigolactobacillus zhaoyuanensis]|uniref:DMT family transporter n=1 Tax=Loigolactobacillus zhaoyuanensis TaxID=2486017 RepID=UPI000F73961A|nr:DMT family transporter [Loigolactobacillus zhaoyuanensis]
MLAVMIGLLIGIGLPMQTSINSRLRQSLGSPFLASLISFALGTVFLAAITLIGQHTLLISAVLLRQQPIWLWLGGIFGVIYLTGNILLFPKLGSVQTVIMPVLGQIIAGLLIDNYGLFYSLATPLSVSRLLGALLVLLGIVGAVGLDDWLAQRGKKIHQEAVVATTHGGLWLWRLLGVLAGMFSATQTAINGHLGQVLGSTMQAAFISFFVGTVALLIVVLILRPKFQFKKGQSQPWWMWIGGLIGAFYVLGNVYLVPLVGTGLAVVIVLVGLMVGSLLIDQFGWLESRQNPVTRVQLLNLAVMVAGVMLIRLV